MALTERQLGERRNYLGGSDIAKVLGLSRWGTPLSVWAEKTGNLIPEDISGKMPVKLGIRMEQIVAELFEEEMGKKLQIEKETIYHPQYPFLAANIDRRVEGEDAIVEIKTASAYKYREWEQEEMPVEYLIQTAYYMALTGVRKGYLCCLIGNTDLKIKEINKDENLFADIIGKAVYFWQEFVEKNQMPAPIAGDGSTLYRLFPLAAEESIIDLGDKGARVLENLDSLKADRKVLDMEIEGQENHIKAMLGNYETGIAGKFKITWKKQTTMRIDIDRMKKEEPGLYESWLKPTMSRVFRFSVNKLKI